MMELRDRLCLNPNEIESSQTSASALYSCLFQMNEVDSAQELVCAFFRLKEAGEAFSLLVAYLRRFEETSFHDDFERCNPEFIKSFRQAVLTEVREALQNEFEVEVFPYLLDQRSFDQAANKLAELAQRLSLTDLLQLLPELTASIAHHSGEAEDHWVGLSRHKVELTASIAHHSGEGSHLLETVDWSEFEKALNRTLYGRAGIAVPPVKILLGLARSYTIAVQLGYRRYRVCALFVRGNLGIVRDVWVSVWENPAKQGVLDLDYIDHSLQIDSAFNTALENGRIAAQKYVQNQYQDYRCFLVRPFFEMDPQVAKLEGPSIGLAIAIATIARVIGLQVSPAVAVTGAIDQTGAVQRVGGIGEKIGGVLAHNRQAPPHDSITGVIVPDENAEEARRSLNGGTMDIHGASSLNQVITEGILIDPWEPYLKKLCHIPKDGLTDDQAGQALQKRWTLLICRYDGDKQAPLKAPLKALAFWSAEQRLRPGGMIPVPFFLNALTLQKGIQSGRPLLPEILEQLCDDEGNKIVQPRSEISQSLLLQQLQGGTLLLLDGTDNLTCSKNLEDHEPLPSLVKALAFLFSRSSFARCHVAVTCNEATAEALKAILTPYQIEPEEIQLYEGRSNFLDQHRKAVLKGAERRILACRIPRRGTAGDYPTPEKFFYDQTCSLYVGIRVREVGMGKAELRRLEEVIGEGYDDSPASRQLLLLGEGGAGKSTELLKIFFDCVAESSSSPLKGRFTPWLLRLSSLFDQWRQKPQGITRDGFLKWLQAELTTSLPLKRFVMEIQWTPRLLILMDGLDEIQPASQDVRNAIGTVLKTFFEMCPSAWVVLASRDKEEERGERSLLELDLFDAWRRFTIEDLDWSEDKIGNYIQRAGCSSDEANALLELLRPQPELLRNPMLLYLFASAAPATLRGKSLSPAVLYQAAVRTWLDEEVNKRSFPFDPPTCLQMAEVLVKLMAVLAVGMKEREETVIEEARAETILGKFIRDNPAPPWWPTVKEGERKGKALGYERKYNQAEILQLVNALRELPFFL